MPDDSAPLKRLGSGRWQTRDQRFTIESESGRWVVVDAEQTDELGLPRVTGPYASLTAARDALGSLREDRAESPLASRLEASRRRAPLGDAGAGEKAAANRGQGRRGAARTRERGTPRSERNAKGAPPRTPTWLDDVPARDRARAEQLAAALLEAGVNDPGPIIAQDLAGLRPLVAEALLQIRIEALVAGALDDAGGRLGAAAARSLGEAILGATTAEPAGGLPGWELRERREGAPGRVCRPASPPRRGR